MGATLASCVDARACVGVGGGAFLYGGKAEVSEACLGTPRTDCPALSSTGLLGLQINCVYLLTNKQDKMVILSKIILVL